MARRAIVHAAFICLLFINSTVTADIPTVNLFAVPFPSTSCKNFDPTKCIKPDISCDVVEDPCQSSGGSCPTYTRDCYCNFPVALDCAWDCDWLSYMYIEDWYRTICGPRPINFTELPGCAKKCVETKLFDYGCVTFEKNCFCQHNSTFTCEDGCDEKGKQGIVTWLERECSLSDTGAQDVIGDLEPDTIAKSGKIVANRRAPRRWYWYEIVTVVILSFSALLFFVVLIYLDNA